MAKISVVMPIYNTNPYYLDEAIQSVLNQTYTDYEIIIVNDGSTHLDTLKYLKNITYENIRIINQDNKGIAGALNTGIKNMKSEWFTWLSSDDRWMPNKLELQMNFVNGYKDRKIIYTDFNNIDENGKFISKVREPEFDNLKDLQFRLCHWFFGCGSCIMIHESCFGKVGLFNENLRVCEDHEMWGRLAKHYMFYRIPVTLMEYRTHMDTMRMKEPKVNKIIKDVIEMVRKELDYPLLSKVSVIIPCYNEEKTIAKTLGKLCNDSRIDQIIVIDDGSTDNTRNIVMDLLQTNHEIELVMQSNMGRGYTRSVGFNKVRNNFMVTLDGDVIPTDGWLDMLIETLDKYRLDIVAGSVKWESSIKSMWSDYYDFYMTQNSKASIGTAITLYKTKSLDEIGFLDSNMTSGEDSEMFMRLQKNGCKFMKIPDILGTHVENRTFFECLERHYEYGKDRAVVYSKHSGEMQGQINPAELNIDSKDIIGIIQNLCHLVGTLGFRDKWSEVKRNVKH